MSDFDVIVIGGRPAGSTLAARLGKFGFNVLLLERATLPSLPAASTPIIYAPTMQLLDEIGADEAAYAHNTPKIHTLHFSGQGYSKGFPIPPGEAGRDYGYAIDRARFDHALWETAARYPTVTAIQNFHVTDLLWDFDRVSGVVGHGEDKQTVQYTADVVVGADGRYSLVARKTNAQVVDEHTGSPTSIYYAYWRGLRPHNDEAATSVAYEGKPGVGYLVMDSADNTAAVAVEGRSDVVDPTAGKMEDFYLDMLRQQPGVWARVQDAEMVTNVRGMRNITNLYRQPGGAGWALVGDAYHQKDPLDGQGIYNAVFTSKALAWALRYWRDGEKTWDEALAWYDETARIKTYAMYKLLMRRVKESFYPAAAPPAWMTERLSRWLFDDPQLSAMFGQYVTRQIPAEMMNIMTTPVMMRALVRGGLREMRERLPF